MILIDETDAKIKLLHAEHARKNFSHPTGDHMTLLNIYNQWLEANESKEWCRQNFLQFRSLQRAKLVREQLISLLEASGMPIVSNPDDPDSILKSVTSGFFFHAARLTKSLNYRTFYKPKEVFIHPSSSLYVSVKDKSEESLFLKPWVVYHELWFTNKEYMRQISGIDPKWLIDIAPHIFKEKDVENKNKKMPKQIQQQQLPKQV